MSDLPPGSWRHYPATVELTVTELDISVGEEFARLRENRRQRLREALRDARKLERERAKYWAQKGAK